MNKTGINILLIENNPQGMFVIHDFLCSVSKNYNLIWHRFLSDSINNPTIFSLDLIVMNSSLPDGSRLSSLRKIKKKYPHVPVIVIHEMEDDELRTKLLDAGAVDFVAIDKENDLYIFCEKLFHAIDRETNQMTRCNDITL